MSNRTIILGSIIINGDTTYTGKACGKARSYPRPLRAAIKLIDGRMYCTGEDITPSSQGYIDADVLLQAELAQADLALMYAGDCWGLELENLEEPEDTCLSAVESKYYR